MDEVLNESSASAKFAMQQSRSVTFKAEIKTLALPSDFLSPAKPENQSHLMIGLSQIGAVEKHKDEVDQKTKWILSFKKMGQGWSESITVLMKVIRSKNLNTMDKLVAYRAPFLPSLPL